MESERDTPSPSPSIDNRVSTWLLSQGENIPPTEPLLLVSFNESAINLVLPSDFTLVLHGSNEVVSWLICGELGAGGCARRTLASAVSANMSNLYAVSQLPAEYVGAGLTDQYVRQFAHPAIHHLLQLMGTHHSELSRHLELFSGVQGSIQQLQEEASVFCGENQNAVIKLQTHLNLLNSRILLVDTAAATFTRNQTEAVSASLAAYAEEQALRV